MSFYDQLMYEDWTTGGLGAPRSDWETRHRQAFRAEGPSLAKIIADDRRAYPNAHGLCAGCIKPLGSENEERGAFRYHPQCAQVLDDQGLKRLHTDETPSYEWRDE